MHAHHHSSGSHSSASHEQKIPLLLVVCACIICLALGFFASNYISSGSSSLEKELQANYSSLQAEHAKTLASLSSLQANFTSFKNELEMGKNKSITERASLEQAALLKSRCDPMNDTEFDTLLKSKLSLPLSKLKSYAASTLALSSDANEFEKSSALIISGDDVNASSMLSDAITLNQNLSDSYLMQAGTNCRLGNYPVAGDSYAKAFNSQNCMNASNVSECQAASWGIASAYFYLGDYNRSKQFVDLVSADSLKDDWKLLETRGDIYLRNGACEQAMPAFTDLFSALGYNINDERMTTNLGKYCRCQEVLGQMKNDTCVLPDPVHNIDIVGRKSG